MSCALDRRSNEFIEELLPGIFARRSALCGTEGCQQAHTKKCDRAFCEEVLYHTAILPAVSHPHEGVRAALSNAQRLSLGKRGQKGRNRSVVAKRLADVGKPVDVSWSEDEAA